jgi:UDP-N-acetyl-D-mannosaminuronate dehydrogenase
VPYVATLPQDLADFPNVTLMSAKHLLESADLVALLVDHSAFGDLAPNGKPVIDTQGITR